VRTAKPSKPKTQPNDEHACPPPKEDDTGQQTESTSEAGESTIQKDGASDPVIIATGEFFSRIYDLRVDEEGQTFSVIRRYSNQSDVDQGFGYGWDSNLYARVEVMATEALVHTNDRLPIKFAKSGGSYDDNGGSSLSVDGSGKHTMTLRNGVKWYFDTSGRVISKTLRTGHAYVWVYDGTNKVSAIEDDSGNDIYTFAYDGTLITKAQDVAGGRDVVYEYDAVSRDLTKTSGSCGSCSSQPAAGYVYDASHNMVTIRNGRGQDTLVNLYDGQARVTKQIRKPGVEATFDWSGYSSGQIKFADFNAVTRQWHQDSQHRVTKFEVSGEKTGGLRNLLWTYEHDENGNRAKWTNADGREVVTPRAAIGKQDKFLRHDGANTITHRDFKWAAHGQATRVTAGDGKVTDRKFDASGNRLTRVRDSGGLNLAESWDYDSRGNVLTRTSGAGNKVAYLRDAKGRVTKMIADPDSGGGGLALDASYLVDAVGRVTRRTDERGGVWKTWYAPSGKVTRSEAPSGMTTLYAYDADHNLITRTQQDAPPRKQSEHHSHDGLSLRPVQQPDPANRPRGVAYGLPLRRAGPGDVRRDPGGRGAVHGL